MATEPLRLEELPLPVVVVTGQVVADLSPSAARLVGRPAADLVGTGLAALAVPEDRARLIELLAQAEAGSPGEVMIRLDGPVPRPVAVLVTTTAAGQRLVALRDLTLERRLSAVIDAVADSTLLLDADGRLLWQSAALAARVPGGAANLGTHPMERLHPEDLPLVLEAFSDLSRHPGGRLNRIVRSRSVDNDDLWQLIELVGASRVDDPDLGGVVVQVRNIEPGSELASVGQTDGPLLSLAEAAPIGILLMNRIEQVLYLSQAGRLLLGFGEVDDADTWRDRFPSPGRLVLDELVAAGLVGAEATTATIAFGRPGGFRGSMRLRVAAHLDARHQPVGVIVALEDVTAEVEARAESERLLQMLDATSDFVAIFRPSGEILHTNAALAQMLENHRAAGGTGRLGDLVEDREGFINRGLAVVANQDTWHGELNLRVAPGRTMPVSALGVVRRDEAGDLDWVAMVARDISQQKEAEQRLRNLATSDHLTGLANRALFTEQLDQVVAEARRTGRSVTVLFCDLDRFKEVNDRHGHAVGDAVLVQIAERLCTMLRTEDFVARVGGDEFVIICGGADRPDALAALADRLIHAIHEPIDVSGALGAESSTRIGAGSGRDLDRRGRVAWRPGQRRSHPDGGGSGHVPSQGHRRQPVSHPTGGARRGLDRSESSDPDVSEPDVSEPELDGPEVGDRQDEPS